MLEARLPFEEKVSNVDEDICSRIRSWKAYIDFEIKDDKLSRAQRLYDRAVLEILNEPNSSDENSSTILEFFNDYVYFAAAVVKDFKLLGISNQDLWICCSNFAAII